MAAMAVRRFTKSGRNFFATFGNTWKDTVRAYNAIAKDDADMHENPVLLNQANLELYFRFKAGKLARPKKRKGNSLYERGEAIAKHPLAVFVFDVIALDAALDSVLVMVGEAMVRAEEPHCADEDGERFAMWEQRESVLSNTQCNGEWDVLVKACKQLDFPAIKENAMPELECA